MPSICNPLYDLLEEVEDEFAADLEKAGAEPLPKFERPNEEPPSSREPEQAFSEAFRAAGVTEWVSGNSFIRTRLSGSAIFRPSQTGR